MLEFFFIELLFNTCYIFNINLICSIQFSHSVLSNSLWPHELQHARLPCPSPTPRTCSNSCPSSRWPSNNLILFHPLLLLPSIFPNIRVFSNESVLCIRWPKYWSFSISPSNEYSGLISFRMDCFDLLAVQGTLRSLCQHHSSATAKSLQSCPTLCNPIDGSPPGFPVPGILQARTLE